MLTLLPHSSTHICLWFWNPVAAAGFTSLALSFSLGWLINLFI